MVLGIVGVVGLCVYGFGVIAGILALVFGYQARRDIRNVGPHALAGDGQAKAGIILGWVSVGLTILGIALVVFLIAVSSTGTPTNGY